MLTIRILVEVHFHRIHFADGFGTEEILRLKGGSGRLGHVIGLGDEALGCGIMLGTHPYLALIGGEEMLRVCFLETIEEFGQRVFFGLRGRNFEQKFEFFDGVTVGRTGGV